VREARQLTQESPHWLCKVREGCKGEDDPCKRGTELQEAAGGFLGIGAAEERERTMNITLRNAAPWAAGGLAQEAEVAESIALW